MKLNAKSRAFLCEKIENYLENFGKFNKNDFEVLIFQSILVGQEIPLSNYALSRELKIKESKVKNLRYEADLLYNRGSDYEKEKYLEFIRLFAKAKYKVEKADTFKYKLEFVIEDPSLRKFIDGKMKEAGTYTDTSFNSEIVKISPEDLAIVLETFPEGRKLAENIMKEVNNLIRVHNLNINNGKPLSFSEVFPSLLLHTIQTASNVTSLVSNFTPEKLLGSITISLINRIKKEKN